MEKRLFLIGYMGAGKTTIGRKLAENLAFSFVDLDWYIEQRYHKTVGELFTECGEAGFRKIEQKMLHEVSDFENVIISTGGGAPCYADNMSYMNEKGITIYLQLTPLQLFERLKTGKRNRPLLKDKTDEELLQFITSMLKERTPVYEQAKVIFEHGNLITSKDVKETTLSLTKILHEKHIILSRI